MSLIGRQLGDFLLDKKLGAGGMGEVYRAKQISLDRTVAIKILPKSLAAQEGFDERFKREARAAANLIHPNVIQVYHIGIDPELGTPYFAMEYVEGEDLQQRIKRLGSLTFEMSVEILAGVTAALSMAFERGIIHRDIKPSNIMIDKNEIVKVMDFGLAKATQDAQAANLTQSGLIMGTPNYISPEAGKGDPVDSRSDIYSLGVAFYELLCGKLPFTASTPAAIIYKHVYEPAVPPSQISKDVPPFLEEICLRMIAKDPKDRYPNPKALLADFNDFKRNMEHYLAGGARKSPLIGTGSVAGDATLTASGTYPGRPGVGSKTSDQTQNFQMADTKADTGMLTRPNTPATPASVILTPARSPLTTAAIAAVVVAALGAGGVITWKMTSKPAGGGPLVIGASGGDGGTSRPTITAPAGKVLFPISALEKSLPKTAEIVVKVGFADQDVTRGEDIPVDPGSYMFGFKRNGFNTIQKQFQVAADGTITPALETLKFTWVPKDEFKRNVDLANHIIEDKKYKEAVEILKGVVEKAPDYEEAIALLATAKKGQAELATEFKHGNTLYLEHKWAEAVQVLRGLPDTYEDSATVISMVNNSERNLADLGQYRKAFERQFADGQFSEAAETLVEVDKLVPSGDQDQRKARERLREAGKQLESAQREMDGLNFQGALTYLEPLLKDSPNHKEASRMAAKARAEVAKHLGAAQQIEGALGAGEKAFALGQFDSALTEAMRALAVDGSNKAAQDLRDRAQGRVGENEISRRFGALDDAFRTLGWGSRDKRVFSLNEMIDPAARSGLDAEISLFSLSPIEVKEAAHSDFAVKISGAPGSEVATVECNWNLKLGFPEADGAVPPARGRDTAMTVRQRVGLKRVGAAWLFTSFEQIGKANVQ